jgi:hypothetical protein
MESGEKKIVKGEEKDRRGEKSRVESRLWEKVCL